MVFSRCNKRLPPSSAAKIRAHLNLLNKKHECLMNILQYHLKVTRSLARSISAALYLFLPHESASHPVSAHSMRCKHTHTHECVAAAGREQNRVKCMRNKNATYDRLRMPRCRQKSMCAASTGANACENLHLPLAGALKLLTHTHIQNMVHTNSGRHASHADSIYESLDSLCSEQKNKWNNYHMLYFT